MIRSIVFFFLLSAFLVSCQKEIDWGLTNATEKMLIRVVKKSGTDSVITNYTYDASKRLVREKTTGTWQTVDRDNDMTIVRNSTGVIIKVIEKAQYLIASGVDSVVTRYNYDLATSRYASSVADLNQGGISVSDSVAYRYDMSGRIIRDDHFQSVTGFPTVQLFKQEYVYTASGNIDSVKQFSHNPLSGVFTLSIIYTYMYDTKVNPMKLNNEAILLYRFPLFGANNALRIQSKFISNPAFDSNSDLVFTYTGNKPQTAVSTDMPGAIVSNITYFYQ